MYRHCIPTKKVKGKNQIDFFETRTVERKEWIMVVHRTPHSQAQVHDMEKKSATGFMNLWTRVPGISLKNFQFCVCKNNSTCANVVLESLLNIFKSQMWL